MRSEGNLALQVWWVISPREFVDGWRIDLGQCLCVGDNRFLRRLSGVYQHSRSLVALERPRGPTRANRPLAGRGVASQKGNPGTRGRNLRGYSRIKLAKPSEVSVRT